MSDPAMSSYPHHPDTTSLILLDRTADGWEATQDDVNLVGRGNDPGAAVADYGQQVSKTFYQNQGPTARSGSSGFGSRSV